MNQQKTYLEVAEHYVEWAAGRNFTALHVWRTINDWPALKLTENEKEYIKTLAHRKCPADGWNGFVTASEAMGWLKKGIEKR